MPLKLNFNNLNKNKNSVNPLHLSHPTLHKLETCKTLKQFNQIQAQLIVSNLFQHPLTASRSVMKLCRDIAGMVSYAVSIFSSLHKPDAFIGNTIMRCYVNRNESAKALRFYYGKILGGFVGRNHFTWPIVVKACVDVGRWSDGEKVHGVVVKCGEGGDLFVRNSLIRFYGVSGRVLDARRVFDDGGDVLDLVSWNSMIDGYVKNGEVSVARGLFEVMPERDVFSWNSMVSGYVGVGDMEGAEGLFEVMPVKDVVSWNCMVDGYARVGNVERARELFDRMGFRNVVSWNTMLALYVRCKDYGECLKLFDRMVWEGDVVPNEATFVSVLTASANLGRLEIGKWIHSYLRDNNMKPDVLLCTALLTMYAKCGAMDMASSVFDEMSEKNIVSWNSMIMGYGMHGQGERAVQLFLRMQKSSIIPNDTTFVCLLSACNHAGLILEGWWCFDLMWRVYKIEPNVAHYGCMVDLLARAGLLKDSEQVIKKMPMDAGSALWGALLSSCRTHSYLELGDVVANRLMELDPRDIGPYVLLSNIYAAEGKWEDVERVRKIMQENKLQKVTGSSQVHLGESQSEPAVKGYRNDMVYSMLSEIGTKMKVFCGGSDEI